MLNLDNPTLKYWDFIEHSPIEEMFLEAALQHIPGLEFQHQVGRYYVDFAIPHLNIAIELDGHDYHKTKGQRTHDAQRERLLERAGWRVIRFTGSEVYRDAACCVQEVVDFISALGDERQQF